MNYTDKTNEEILEWLKINLNKERYEHSIGVAECAKDLATKYGENSEKAYIAGLLHDCAKCFPQDKSIDIANKNLTLENEEKLNKKTIHAPISAYIANKEFGINDKDILSAIRWHTIGNIKMTTFEKIIYIADKIEFKTREKEYAQPIRDCLTQEHKSLDFALLQSYKQTIISLVKRNLKICKATIDIYNEILSRLNSK